MFHISSQKLDGKVISPRVPSNYFTNYGYEDNTIERICFSDSIDNCLMAMPIKSFDKMLYVYSPAHPVKVVSNREIVKNMYVPDAHITGECWSIEDTKLMLIARIKVISLSDISREFKYGSNTRRTYMWNYELLG